MKIKIIFLLLLFHLTGLTQNDKFIDNIEITYNKAYKNHKDTTKTEPKILKNIEYKLICNRTESYFEYIPSMSIDGNNNTNERFIGKGGGKGIYYKNLKTKVKLKSTTIFDETFLITENFNEYNWKLLKESKKILDYICYKAIGTKTEYNAYLKKNITIKIIAWYAPSVSIPFGPAGYDGLPGIVLEAKNGSFHFIANEIKYSDKEHLKIKKPTDGIKISREEYNKKSIEYIKQVLTKDQ